MTLQDHPSEEQLLAVLADKESAVNQSEIETHISTCTECLSRLQRLVDDDWLNKYRDCLTAELLSEDARFGSGIHDKAVEHLGRQTRQRGSEFERDAINRMLQKILAPPTHPETLGRLGRYEIESTVGMGGMGLVLRGYDRDLQRPVAIKLMSPRFSTNGTAKQRFAREARAVATILHPNVIAIHGIEETSGMPWFVMPFVAGPSLKELVGQTGPLPEREIVRIGLQLASGLAAAHGQGLVHRDIKPENVLVDNQINRVVITDFGLVQRESEESLTQTGVLAGTLNYMSPEQTRGEDIDGRSDLFSLGSLMYFLATGRIPFQSETPAGVLHKIANTRHVDARSVNPEISRALSGTIDRLLAKKPSRRFQSAANLEEFLADFIAHLNKPTKNRLPSQSNLKRTLVRFSVAAIVCVAVVVAGTWAVQFVGQASTRPANGSPSASREKKQDNAIRNESNRNWTSEHAAVHADSFNDPDKWDRKYLSLALQQLEEIEETTLALPFPFTSFPAPNARRTLDYANRATEGTSVSVLRLRKPYVGSLAAMYDRSTGADKSVSTGPVEPLMLIVVAGDTDLKNVEQQTISWSHPHYFFQGSFTNTTGDIDWLAVRTASGKQIGIVNGRILDLSLGNLILVRQLDDGSVCIFQNRKRIESVGSERVHAVVDKELATGTCANFFNEEIKWTDHSQANLKSSPLAGSKTWTAEQLSDHADNSNSSRFWNRELLLVDASSLKRPLPHSKAAMPFPWVAFPVPWSAFPVPYYLNSDVQYGGLRVGPVTLPDDLSGVMASVNRHVDPTTIPAEKNLTDVLVTEPLMIVIVNGKSPVTSGDLWAISRSLPHFFFQGFYETADGQIDWVAIRMQDGTELGIINGRVIDLSQGNLVLVNQDESGMVAIYQCPHRVEPGTIKRINGKLSTLFGDDESNESNFMRAHDILGSR